MAPRNDSGGLIPAYILAGLNRLERWFLRRAREVTRQRVVVSRAVLQEVLRSGQVPSELRLPGQEAFEQLCRRFLLEAWALGFAHGEREVARLRARRRAVRFAEVDLAGLPTQARQDVERRLGRLLDWERGWDSVVHQVVVNAVEVGASPDQVEKALDTQAQRLTGSRLAVLARTEETAAYNAGRLGSFRSNSWLVEAVQFIGTTDERTTEVCRSRAGLIMGLDDPRLAGMTPPLHYGCRSVLVPVDKFDMEALRQGDPAVERRVFRNQPPGAPRSLEQAMDGWETAPRPPSGFGGADDLVRGGGTSKSGNGGGASEPPGGTVKPGEGGEEKRTPWVRGEKRRNLPVSFFEDPADGLAFLEQQQNLSHSCETFDGRLLRITPESIRHVFDHRPNEREERLIQVPAIIPMVQNPYGILTGEDIDGRKSFYFGTIDPGEEDEGWFCVILRPTGVGLDSWLDTWFTMDRGLGYILEQTKFRKNGLPSLRNARRI